MHARALALLSVFSVALIAAPAHGQRVVTRSCWYGSEARPGACSGSYESEDARIARQEAARERSRERALEVRERAAARTRERAVENAERASERARAAALRADERAWRERDARVERVERAERLREQAAERAFQRRIRYQRWN